MKKNKTIAYMLAAALLVGGTFVGTKAMFKDTVKVAGELSISTGDVDLEVVESETKWKLDRNGSELAEGTKGIEDNGGKEGYAGIDNPSAEIDNETTENSNFANNLKYGDVLTKTVIVQNVGTLNATNLEIVRNKESNMPSWISVETGNITDLEGNKIETTSVIEPKDKVKVELKLTVNAEGQHNKTGQNSDNQENQIIDLIDAWTLTAQQTTK